MSEEADKKVKEMIGNHGDQAYHKAIKFSVIATRMGDKKYAEFMADVAQLLMQLGYHKHQKKD